MNVTFQCPSCLRTLYYEGGESAFQTCIHCKGKIIVPSDAVHQAEVLEQSPTDYSLIEQKNLRLAEIHKEAQSGRKIQAIKMFRETFGTDLREAKEAVERLERGGKVDLSRSALKQNYAVVQEQTPTGIQTGTPDEQQEAKSRAVILAAIILAIGIAIFFFLTEN